LRTISPTFPKPRDYCGRLIAIALLNGLLGDQPSCNGWSAGARFSCNRETTWPSRQS